MSTVKDGNRVKVNYKGFLDDGSIFDETTNQPLEFIVGQGTVIPGFEKAVIGMEQGQKKVVSIPPEEAYGDYSDDLILQVNRAEIPEHITPEVGMALQARTEEGQVTNLTIKDINDEQVTLDGNHPLAGKNIKFEIELLEVA